MQVFSFYTKRQVFTVWDIYYTYEPLDENRRYKISNYKYLGTVNEQSENIDTIAYNRIRSFKHKDIEFTNNDTFRFGKYEGRKIKDVKDLRYTKWYFKQIEDANHKKFIKDYLYDNWYEFRTSSDGEEYAVSPITIKYENQRKIKQNDTLKKAINGKKVLLEITSNPKEDGRIIVDGVVYYFPKVVSRYYEGYTYYVPITNGKAKRIKNKIIEANLFELNGQIFISNFTVVK